MVDFLNILEQDMLFYVVILVIIILILILIYFIWLQSKDNRYSVNDLKDNELEDRNSFKEAVEVQKQENQEENRESNDTMELKNISKELEMLAKDHRNEISMYESLQEETAIISYDELLSKTTNLKLEELNNEEKDEDKEDIKGKDYIHEESYLKDLKQLNDSLK